MTIKHSTIRDLLDAKYNEHVQIRVTERYEKGSPMHELKADGQIVWATTYGILRHLPDKEKLKLKLLPIGTWMYL